MAIFIQEKNAVNWNNTHSSVESGEKLWQFIIKKPSLCCENLAAFKQFDPEIRYRESIFKLPEYKMFQNSQAFPTLFWFCQW